MKLTVGKGNLEIILNHLQAFLDKKDSSQITSHIYFESFDNKFIIKATDQEIGIESKIDIVKKDSDGKGTVNGKKILDIVRSLKDGEVLLEINNGFFYVKQGKSNFKLPMFNAEGFPSFPDLTNYQKINIDSLKFLYSLKKISPAIESNNQKPELGGALLDIKEYSLNFAATDTRRLAVIKHDTQSIENFKIIIPKKAIAEILKLFYDDLEFFCNQVYFVIKTTNYTFFTKLINGKFPDYERITPKTFLKEIKLPKDIITDSINLINSLTANIKITIHPNEIIFESISDENSGEKATTQIEINTNIDSEVVIGINSRSILDFLSQVENSEFSLCLNEPNTASVLKDENFLTIVMPILL